VFSFSPSGVLLSCHSQRLLFQQCWNCYCWLISAGTWDSAQCLLSLWAFSAGRAQRCLRARRPRLKHQLQVTSISWSKTGRTPGQRLGRYDSMVLYFLAAGLLAPSTKSPQLSHQASPTAAGQQEQCPIMWSPGRAEQSTMFCQLRCCWERLDVPWITCCLQKPEWCYHKNDLLLL